MFRGYHKTFELRYYAQQRRRGAGRVPRSRIAPPSGVCPRATRRRSRACGIDNRLARCNGVRLALRAAREYSGSGGRAFTGGARIARAGNPAAVYRLMHAKGLGAR